MISYFPSCLKNCNAAGSGDSNDKIETIVLVYCTFNCDKISGYSVYWQFKSNDKKVEIKDNIIISPDNSWVRVHRPAGKEMTMFPPAGANLVIEALQKTNPIGKAMIPISLDNSKKTKDAGCKIDPKNGTSIDLFTITCSGFNDDLTFLVFQKLDYMKELGKL